MYAHQAPSRMPAERKAQASSMKVRVETYQGRPFS